MAILDEAQYNALTKRVAERFRRVGVNPEYLTDYWTLDGDGLLTATAVIRMTPEEAADLFNGGSQ